MTYKPSSAQAEDFIHHESILDIIDYGRKHAHNRPLIEGVLKKAALEKGLDPREAFLLLACQEEDLNQKIYQLARDIKLKIYGRRIVLFAPLYLSNYCINGCVYCPFHGQNKDIPRKKLSQEEIRQEVIALQDMGHKRLALETGEDPLHSPIDYVLESIDTIYSIHHKNGDIRRVNVNIAATSVEEYRMLKEAGIGTYILFQETYHKDNYEALHPKGPKSDYAYHTEAMDRAMEGGIDDVGMGVLFGLNNFEYDFIGLMMHAAHLEARFGVGPHTVSVPRIRSANDIDPDTFENAISDEVFKKIVACIRIALPYTGMIISTRESQETRQAVLDLGISQVSGGSKTSVGGYALDRQEEALGSEQFDLADNRTLDEVIYWLLETDHIPSFCTACYRAGRTGDRFMALAKTGEIGQICQPNALMTLQEYLCDYASPRTRALGDKVIQRTLGDISDPLIQKKTRQWIQDIQAGQRDFRL
ncbi:MAG: [FeFe] hydrogenase H-cluster radical SAM maturase HydG [Tissierellia bacterium]|nr:[FeFe] hydrogenase H-cluster radical SAM maturase HydG [Tissierellia bacterium]